MQIVNVHVCTWPNVVDVTDQDCLNILRDTRLLGDFTCQPSPRPTIIFCFPTYIIPTQINFGVRCEKIDIVNKVFLYVIKLVSRIVTVISFLFCCVIVVEFFTLFIWIHWQCFFPCEMS